MENIMFFIKVNNVTVLIDDLNMTRWEFVQYVGFFLMFFVCLLALCGNALVILVSIMFWQHLHVTNYYYFSASLADLLIGIGVMPSVAYIYNKNFLTNQLHCQLTIASVLWLSGATLMNCSLVTLQNIINMAKNLRYQQSNTNHTPIFVTILMSWITCFIFGFGSAFQDWHFAAKDRESEVVPCLFIPESWTIVGGILVCILLTHLNYAILLIVVYAKWKKVDSHDESFSSKKVILKIFVVRFFVHIICWWPITIQVVFEILRYPQIFSMSVRTFCAWIAFSHSSLQPWLLLIMPTQLRSKFLIFVDKARKFTFKSNTNISAFELHLFGDSPPDVGNCPEIGKTFTYSGGAGQKFDTIFLNIDPPSSEQNVVEEPILSVTEDITDSRFSGRELQTLKVKQKRIKQRPQKEAT